MYRRDRINERDVPESQHTIFIRGLPGTMTTEEIREHFEKHGGCSFDFVKVSPDRSKLYVAVRFDQKNVAKEVMEKYGTEGKILGYECELTWFRDIRRYLAHCAKQGIRPSRFRDGRGGRREDRGGGLREQSKSPIRTRASHTPGNSRSPSQRSGTRSRSHSPERGGQDVENRSPSPVRSVHTEPSRSRSRSRSPSSVHSPSHSPQKIMDYNDMKKERDLSPTPPPKKNKKKKERRERKKRRHPSPTPSPTRSGSDAEQSEDEHAAYIEQKKQQLAMQKATQEQEPMTMTSAKPIGPQKPEISPQQVYQPFAHRHLPVGSVAANQQFAHAITSNKDTQQQPQPDSSSGYGQLHQQLQQQQNMFRQTFTVDLDQRSTNVPMFKPIGESAPQPGIVYQSVNGTKIKEEIKRPRMETPPPPAAIRNVKNSAAHELLNASPIRESGPLATNVFREIQRHILQDVRYKAQEPEEESLGGLRLSLLSKQRMTDDMRDEKIAKLSPELRDRVNKKKRQLELSYRHDCETFGLVTRKLIEKDRSLEDRLKVALLETMKDLEEETMKQLDEFLDQLSFICA